MEIINATDGYKLGHHRMYPEGTEQVYSNWTPRSNKILPRSNRRFSSIWYSIFN